MENLIKPVDYAAKVGISRQAVYAKIKKGILPSRNVGGKIYIVLEEEPPDKPQIDEKDTTPQESRKLLEAKEETIAVLKETIRDLKETNRMITTTLRSEVELLKEAFGEMKTLYAAQIEHIQRQPEPIALAEIAQSAEKPPITEESDPQSEEEKEKAAPKEEEPLCLRRLLKQQGIAKKSLRKAARKLARAWFEEKKNGVYEKEGELCLSPKRARKLLRELAKRS